MKTFLRKLCSPLLNRLESGSGSYHYKPSHRFILWIVSALFAGLAVLTLLWPGKEGMDFLFPVVIYCGVSLVALAVAALGSDRAVAKLWGSKKV